MTDPTADAAKLLPCPTAADIELAGRVLVAVHNSNTTDRLAAAQAIAEWRAERTIVPQPTGRETDPNSPAYVMDRIRKDCGFCGGSPTVKREIYNGPRALFSITCSTTGCPASSADPPQFGTAEQVIARWNTRPQPAPPAMEETTSELKLNIASDKHTGAQAVNPRANAAIAEPTGTIETITAPPAGEPDFVKLSEMFADEVTERERAGAPSDDVIKCLSEFGERMYRLGLAARPKVDDAEVAEFVHVLRSSSREPHMTIGGRPFALEAADLLERLAVELADAYRNKSIIAEFFDMADKRAEAAESKLAEREAELAEAAIHLNHEMRHRFIPLTNRPASRTEITEWLEHHAARQQQQKASAEPTERRGE